MRFDRLFYFKKNEIFKSRKFANLSLKKRLKKYANLGLGECIEDAYGHFVLSQSASFVAANDRSAAKSLDSFEIFDETIFTGHSFGSESQAHCHCS